MSFPFFIVAEFISAIFDWFRVLVAIQSRVKAARGWKMYQISWNINFDLIDLILGFGVPFGSYIWKYRTKYEKKLPNCGLLAKEWGLYLKRVIMRIPRDL